MSMSKKDFIALADAIREHNRCEQAGNDSGDNVAMFRKWQLETLADFCHHQNPRFMRDRWLGYISVENGKNGGKVKATKPTYEVQGNYGQGWETVNTEEGSVAALRSLREYRENEPQFAHRLVRVKE